MLLICLFTLPLWAIPTANIQTFSKLIKTIAITQKKCGDVFSLIIVLLLYN